MQQAIEASRGSKLVQALLSPHPDAVATARLEDRGGTRYWLVGWWTKDRMASGLPYPDVLVYVDACTGQIVWDYVPKSGNYTDNAIFCGISASATNIDVDKGQETTISATQTPASSGNTIVIEYSSDGVQWNQLAQGKPDAKGQYSFAWSPNVGTWHARAFCMSQDAGGMSSPLTIAAVPEFSNVGFVLTAALALVALTYGRRPA